MSIQETRSGDKLLISTSCGFPIAFEFSFRSVRNVFPFLMSRSNIYFLRFTISENHFMRLMIMLSKWPNGETKILRREMAYRMRLGRENMPLLSWNKFPNFVNMLESQSKKCSFVADCKNRRNSLTPKQWQSVEPRMKIILGQLYYFRLEILGILYFVLSRKIKNLDLTFLQ